MSILTGMAVSSPNGRYAVAVASRSVCLWCPVVGRLSALASVLGFAFSGREPLEFRLCSAWSGKRHQEQFNRAQRIRAPPKIAFLRASGEVPETGSEPETKTRNAVKKQFDRELFGTSYF